MSICVHRSTFSTSRRSNQQAVYTHAAGFVLLAVNEKVHATLDRTQKLPFSVRYEATHVAGVAEVLQIDAGTVVRPRAELERTELVVERKPRDVDLARAHEKSGRDPQAVAGRVDHHVGRERAVNVFVGANGTKHGSIVWCKKCFDMLNRLGVDHECDRQMDGQTDGRTGIAVSNSAKNDNRPLFYSL